MSRVLLTGATGFLGRHLVDQLIAQGDEVVALVRGEGHGLPEGAVPRRGDVLDAASVRDAAAGCALAYHCAGQVSRETADAEAMYRVHVEGTKATLAALKEAGVGRVVVASTSGTIAVSSDPEEIRNEDAPTPMDYIARWPYYRSKLFAERIALEKNDEDFEVVVVNPSLLLGPGDERGSSTDDVRKFLERKIPFCPGGGIAFVDARDAASAMILAMRAGAPGRRYLVNAANMTLAAFFGRLERLSGVMAPPLKLPRAPVGIAGVGADLLGRAARALNMPAPVDKVSAEMAQLFWYCDDSRARAELGFAPREPNDTLMDTIDDLRARGVVWPR